MSDERYFSIKTATTIGRISRGQAASWAKNGFFVPSQLYWTESRPYGYLFSFSDLVALRVTAILREQFGLPLANTKVAADFIRSNSNSPWTELRFWVDDKSVHLSAPSDNAPPIELAPIADEVKLEADKLFYRNPDDYGKVERRRGVASGALVVKGTRIPVSTVVALVDAGWDIDRIRQGYPTLQPEDIQGVMQYVGEQRQVASPSRNTIHAAPRLEDRRRRQYP